MRKQTKIKVVIAVGIALVLGFLGAFGYLLFGTNKVSTDEISYYRVLSGEIEGEASPEYFGKLAGCSYDLPTLEELGPYISCRFDHTQYRRSIFLSFSYCLVVGYREEDYAAKKTWLADTYPTLTEGIGREENRALREFEMDGFQFRAIEGGPYPKYMMFIGTCDKKREIAIIYYEDVELDYITSIQAHLAEETGWKNIAE